MKVSELEGEELDYYVARALGMVFVRVGYSELDATPEQYEQPDWFYEETNNLVGVYWVCHESEEVYEANIGGYEPHFFVPQWSPSTDWSHGGPIIHGKNIAIFPYTDRWAAVCQEQPEDWIDIHMWDEDATGETPLIAAMRAYVSSVYGKEVPDDR